MLEQHVDNTPGMLQLHADNTHMVLQQHADNTPGVLQQHARGVTTTSWSSRSTGVSGSYYTGYWWLVAVRGGLQRHWKRDGLALQERDQDRLKLDSCQACQARTYL